MVSDCGLINGFYNHKLGDKKYSPATGGAFLYNDKTGAK
jgi:hypothetical protein